MNPHRRPSSLFPLPFLLLSSSLFLTSCASYRIPTPSGEATMLTLFKSVQIPKIVIAERNTTILIEGYSGTGEGETITASTGALGTIVGAAAKAAIK